MADNLLVGLNGLHVHSVLLLSDTENSPATALLPFLCGGVLLHRLHSFTQQVCAFGFWEII